MNPSSAGWVKKFGHLVKNYQDAFASPEALYASLKSAGFIYGFNMEIPFFIHPEHRLSEDEKAKINLLTALYFTYLFAGREDDGKGTFVNDIFRFYKEMGMGASNLLYKILSGRSTVSQLEKLLGSRVYLEDNVISKTFNSTITNSLLYIDVLAFRRFLNGEKDLKAFAHDAEQVVINLTYHALSAREKQTKDEKLLALFEASLTYISNNKSEVDLSYRRDLLNRFNREEHLYFLDMACLAVWEDHSLEYVESEFIFDIGKDMGLEQEVILGGLSDVTRFFHNHLERIPQFREQHLALQFYNSMARIVNKLILRNSKRLQKELSESKELVYLLSKSTVRELDKTEKKKVQDQLLDIFKSIPSLAIFILPGGAVLLPIFIKLIPKLLPSAFDENRIEKEE